MDRCRSVPAQSCRNITKQRGRQQMASDIGCHVTDARYRTTGTAHGAGGIPLAVPGSGRSGPGGGAGLRTPLDRVCCLPGTDIAPGRRDRSSSGDSIACGTTISPRSRRSLPAGPRSRPPTAPTGEFGVSGATPLQPGMVGRACPDAGAPRPLVRHPDHAVAPGVDPDLARSRAVTDGAHLGPGGPAQTLGCLRPRGGAS